MITQDIMSAKQCRKLAVLVALTTSIVALTAQETLAIPLEPILDQMGRRIVEGLIGTDSGNQAAQATPPASQLLRDTQEEPVSPQYERTASPPEYPAYSPPTYLPAYPQGYSTYPPGFPSQHPTYPPPAYPPSTYSPVYPSPTPPNYPPGRTATPVIINNF